MASFLNDLNNQPDSKPKVKQEKTKSTGVKTTSHAIEIDQGFKKRKIKKIILLSALATILLVSIVLIYQLMNQVTMPDFTNKTLAEANKWALNNNITIVEEHTYSLDYNEGYVISQEQKANQKIKKNSTIKLTISDGANPNEKISVPNLTTMTGAEVKKWVSDNKLANVSIKEESSTNVEKGNVIKYEFDKATVNETSYTRQDALTIYVSSGLPTKLQDKEIPDFVGKTKSDSVTWCNTNGINVNIEYVISTSVDKDKIVKQSIDAETKVPTGTTITLYVSDGKGLTVPDYSKVSYDQAASYSSDFRVTVQMKYSSDQKYGTFLSQSLTKNKQVLSENNEITVTYSLGKPYLKNIIGTKEADLAALIYDYNSKGLSLTYTIEYVDSDQPKGTIVASSKNSEYISFNEKLTIKVSNGQQQTTTEVDYVPDFSTISKEDAAQANNNLAINVKYAYSDDVAYGQLISQSMAANTQFTISNEKPEITVTYSLGQVHLKNLIGLNESELPSYFYELNRQQANITYEIVYAESEQPKGTVISSSANDQYVSQNSTITITVSSGLATPEETVAPTPTPDPTASPDTTG